MAKSKRIRILFVIGGFGVGGKERQLAELIRHLPRERYQCHLLVKSHDAHYLARIEDHLASFHSLDRKHFSPFDFLRFSVLIDEVRPDIVSSWSDVTSHFCFLARFFSSQRPVLVNCSIRNAPPRLSLRLRLERFCYNLYPFVVANSRAGLAAYGQNEKKGRFVLHNGFDASRIPDSSQARARQQLGLAPDIFVVVMAAGLTELKDHETLLRAADLCRQMEIRFLIVGDGVKRKMLEHMVGELGLEDTVFFWGRRDDVELIFRAADVSVLASTDWFGEGISNSILESMACGTPVIASCSPGTSEVIQEGENGLLFPAGDARALAGNIMELLSDDRKRRHLALQGRQTVADRFSIHSMVTEFDGILDRCMEEKHVV